MPHLFERFYRGESTAVRTQEGSGIGLALVAELAKGGFGFPRVCMCVCGCMYVCVRACVRMYACMFMYVFVRLTIRVHDCAH